MSVLMKDIKKFNDQLKEIDPNMEVDVQFWVFHGKPAARKAERNGDHFIELAIYYNYKKDLVVKVSKNKIISEGDGCMLSTETERIKEEFTQVNQASKKNILQKVAELKNLNLKEYI